MNLITRIKHLIWLYRDLTEHKKRHRIVDFKIRWSSYDVYVHIPLGITSGVELTRITYDIGI